MHARTSIAVAVGLIAVIGPSMVATADPVHPECVGPGTNVGGPISTDTTWTCAGSPYVVTSAVIVRNNATLTIEPCVCVRFKANMGLTVGHTTGAGTLVARGTRESPVIFTTNDPYAVSPPDPALANPGDWVRIFFTNDATDAQFDGTGAYASGSVLEHVVVEYSGSGGATVTAASCSPWLAHCEVHHNASSGIDVNASSAGKVKIEGCRVHDHTNGRGIRISGGAIPVTIERCEIARCTVNGHGGGIYLEGGTNHVVRRNVIEDCVVSGNDYLYGGGMFVNAGTTLVEGNTIRECRAWVGGGIILWENSDGSKITDNLLTGNSATHWQYQWIGVGGGGIHLYRSANCTLAENTVTSNDASHAGGGISLLESGNSTLVANTVSGNSTWGAEGRGTGGGIYLGNSGNCTLTRNTVTGNSTSGSYSHGAGIHLYRSGSTRLNANMVSDNTATGLRADGGGIYLTESGGGNTILDSNTITRNTCGDEGGGVFFWSSGSAKLTSNWITENTAGSNAGGIYFGQSGSCLMIDSVITGNRTNGSSGGIYVHNSPRISFAGDPLTCTYNCICENDGYCVYNNTAYNQDGSGDIDARYVKWCTDDSQDILDCVYDYFDDARLGEVYWDPYVPSTTCADYEWYAWRDLSLAEPPELAYKPGIAKQVCIQITPPDGAQSILLEDIPPVGWMVSDLPGGCVWDPSTQSVKCGPFLSPNFPAEVCYTVTPPENADGEQCFAGTISVDGQDSGICGHKCIEPWQCPYIPADEPQGYCEGCGDCSCATCEDGRVEICEMGGYACAWKKDCNDDLAGMTRAAYIWKNGECYCWDELEENWFPTPCSAPESGCCSDVSEPSALALTGGGAARRLRAQSAERNLPDCYSPGTAFDVTITITPNGASAVALEDQPPQGWIVGQMSEGCELGPDTGKVKCGPYFDPFPVEVHYTVTPPGDAAGEACFTGSVAFDGIVRPIDGDLCVAGVCGAASVIRWESVATHGAAGECGLEIPADGSFVEPRSAGVRKIIVTYDGPVTAGGTIANILAACDVDGTALDVSGITVSTAQGEPEEVIITFTPQLPGSGLAPGTHVPARYLVELTGVGGAAADTNREFSVVLGDAFVVPATGLSDARVTAADNGVVRSLAAAGIDLIDCGNKQQVRADVFTDGRINAADNGLCRSLAAEGLDGQDLDVPCP